MKLFGDSANRWHRAQKAEGKLARRSIGQSIARRIELSKELRHSYQRELLRVTRYSVDNLKSKTLLEIGGRNYAEIAAETIPGIEAIALDPLIHLQQNYSNKCRYIRGAAEEIQLKDRTIDICVCQNAIDHMQSPDKALQEIQRVLKISGKLYISLNVFNSWSSYLLPLLDLLDTPHPHHYTELSFLKLLTRNKYQVDYSYPVQKYYIRNWKVYLGNIIGLRVRAYYCSFFI